MWTPEEQDRIKKFFNSKKGREHMKKLNEKFKAEEEKDKQEKRDEIFWWHKIKDEPFTI